MRPGLEALRGLALFASFGDELLLELNELADLARFGPGEPLFQQGDRLEALHILTAGYVAASRQRASAEALTDIVAPVRAIGLPGVMLGIPALVGVRTVTSARVILVPAAQLLAMIRSRPDLGAPFLEAALSEAHDLAAEVCQLKLRSSAQRLAAYLLDLATEGQESPARFVLPYEKRFLAAKIGCSQENLSRAFATLRGVGVQTRQAVVVVRDLDALREFADLAPAEPAPRHDGRTAAGSGVGPLNPVIVKTAMSGEEQRRYPQ